MILSSLFHLAFNFPRMNFKTFRNNFADIVDLFTEFNSIGYSSKLRLSSIVMVGCEDDGGQSVNAIRALTGFAIDLGMKNGKLLEYRFTNDITCGENEALCSINGSSEEFHIPEQLGELIDALKDPKCWCGPDGRLTKRMILNIRSNCAVNFEIYDLRSSSLDLNHVVSRRHQCARGKLVFVVTGDYAKMEWQFGRVAWQNDHLSAIQSIGSYLVRHMLWESYDNPIVTIKGKLSEMGEAIPVSRHEQGFHLSVVFNGYKGRMEKVMLHFGAGIADFSMLSDQCRLVENTLKRLQEICHKIALKTFSLTPPIVGEMDKITNLVLSDFVRPQLEMVARNLHQTHFLLLHAFESDHGECSGKCSYVRLFRVSISLLTERFKSIILSSVEKKLASWVPFLHEPCARVVKRQKLKRKLEIVGELHELIK